MRLGSADKTVSYDDSARIPLLFRWPTGLPSGLVYEGGVTTLDLMPTILEVVGLPVPARAQGKSRLEEIRHRELGWKAPVFLGTAAQKKVDGRFAQERAVRTKTWKLILRDFPRDELYNIVDDPAETKDLISEPGMKPQIRELATLIARWGRATKDPLAEKLASRSC